MRTARTLGSEAAGAGPVDDDTAEGQQGDPGEHAAHQDDSQRHRRTGRGDDGQGERDRADGVAQRVDYPPGERILKFGFARG